ncbi:MULTISPECIES: GNAT family N-acetyltransferase [unclassified Rhizobium]|uniref:GNAT family N-acetyltransferase n=1 Tax=unclassified Rhizobium TaxID=2613769 RepID=UPI000AC3A53D|nr:MULTISPECIES: GNAT family N-acetyltransferase [unclassified Rhizobium]
MRELTSKTMTVFAGQMASPTSVVPSRPTDVPTSTSGDPRLSIAVHNDMKAVERVWRQLEADTWNSMHQAFDWCYAWVQTHDNPVAIVEGKIDGVLAFILPLEIESHTMVRTAQFIGSAFTNYNSGLFTADFRRRAAHLPLSILSHQLALALNGRADIVRLTHVPLDWRGERHPFSDLSSVKNPNSAFQVRLGPDMEATIAPLNAKARRKKFRSQVRKLDAVGGFEHVRATSTSDKTALLDTFFRQKAARFAAQGLPNVFQAAETQAFFHMALEIDRGGNDVPLELHALRLKGEHAGKIAAIAGLSRKGDHVICQFGSIDDTLMPEASPGELLFWLMIERAALTGAAVFDFGIGDQDYKRRWCRNPTEHHDLMIAITPLGRLAEWLLKGMTRAKAGIKNNATLYSTLQRIRALGSKSPVPVAPVSDEP